MQNNCLSCGYFWWQRTEVRTRQCPSCGISNWDGSKNKRNVFKFDAHEIGQEIVYPWPDGEFNRPKLYRALKSYQYRTKKIFHCWGTPKGLLIKRIS